MKQRRPLFIGLAVVAMVGAIWYSIFLRNPPQQTLDQRVQYVGSQLKCPVCQGESVAASQSAIAQQMRGIIRQQLQSGMSEQAVIQYFQARYGDQIVWSPQWQGFSLLAWLAPIGLLLGGVILLFFVLRDWRSSTPAGGTTTVAAELTAELTNIDQADLSRYRALLEQELADEDPLFARPPGGTDGS